MAALLLVGCSNRPVELQRAEQGALLNREQASVASGRGYNPRTQQMLAWRGLTDAPFEEKVRGLTEWKSFVRAGDPALALFRLALAEVLLEGAYDRLADVESDAAMEELSGLFLAAARESWDVVDEAIDPSSGGAELLTGRTRLALDTYNAAVGGLVETLSDELSSGTRFFWVDMPGGEPYAVELEWESEGAWDPTLFQRFRVAANIAIEGLRFRHLVDALGSSLVAEQLPGGDDFPDDVPGTGIAVPATAVVEFAAVTPDGEQPRRASLTIFDPMRIESTPAFGLEATLSADWTASVADIVAKSRIDEAGRRAMLTPGLYQESAGVYRLQPYDENKIPVLLVHGLRSSPLTWRDVINDMRADPEIRERYQFWTFFYPSGLPIPRSAFLLRERLREAKDRYDPEGDAPWRGKMVVVGHSMGGVITRAILKDVGERLYYAGHAVPLEEFDMDDDLKEHLREVFFYEPEKDIARAVFVSSPFRGSDMAESWFAQFGRNITSLPEEFRRIEQEYLGNNLDKLHPWFRKRGKGTLTGVGSLSPESPFVKALDDSPWRNGVKYHVIVGNEDGDGDGVVKHSSSHLDGTATPEVVVNSGHNAHQSLEGGAAIWEILKLHLRWIDAVDREREAAASSGG
ncbi:MAG: alpha/beta hydrolase [Planctomycetota bacterium]